jgi:hypothetical protein
VRSDGLGGGMVKIKKNIVGREKAENGWLCKGWQAKR